MTELDDRARPRTKALIERLGKLVTYTSVTRTRNATTGETEETSTVHSSIFATPPSRYDRTLSGGDGVLRGDVRLSFAALDLPFTPSTKDKVEFDSTTWRIITVRPIYSGDLETMWTLQLRQ